MQVPVIVRNKKLNQGHVLSMVPSGAINSMCAPVSGTVRLITLYPLIFYVPSGS